MEFSALDIIVIGLILFLGIKGMISGFTRELFNFIGLVGGVAVASRVNLEVGELISKNLYPLQNEPSLKLVGFIATLLAIWLLFTILSSLLNSFSSENINLFSRILGYILTVARYIAIFAIIVVVIKQSDFLSEKLSKYYANSKTFPKLNSIGVKLLNIKDDEKSKDNTNTSSSSGDINLSSFKIDNNATQE